VDGIVFQLVGEIVCVGAHIHDTDHVEFLPDKPLFGHGLKDKPPILPNPLIATFVGIQTS